MTTSNSQVLCIFRHSSVANELSIGPWKFRNAALCGHLLSKTDQNLGIAFNVVGLWRLVNADMVANNPAGFCAPAHDQVAEILVVLLHRVLPSTNGQSLLEKVS